MFSHLKKNYKRNKGKCRYRTFRDSSVYYYHHYDYYVLFDPVLHL